MLVDSHCGGLHPWTGGDDLLNLAQLNPEASQLDLEANKKWSD